MCVDQCALRTRLNGCVYGVHPDILIEFSNRMLNGVLFSLAGSEYFYEI